MTRTRLRTVLGSYLAADKCPGSFRSAPTFNQPLKPRNRTQTPTTMALLATRRIAIPAARAARRSVAPLQVRAFRDEKAAQPPKDAAAGNMEVAKAEAAAPAPQVPQMAPQLRVRNLFDEMVRRAPAASARPPPTPDQRPRRDVC